jgi:hypothetical protein
LIVIVLSGVLGFLWLGLPGVALAASLSALVWWKIVAPQLRRRHADELADLPSWSLEADRDA